MKFRYWDSNAFLGWLAAEPDKIDRCRRVIESAEAGDMRILTSALTIAEVLWIRGRARIPADSAAKIEAFFRHEWIVVRELDRFIAEEARALVWRHNVAPKDAVHIATALRRDVPIEQLDTFDRKLIGLSGRLGEPPLLIGKPGIGPPLPLLDGNEGEE